MMYKLKASMPRCDMKAIQQYRLFRLWSGNGSQVHPHKIAIISSIVAIRIGGTHERDHRSLIYLHAAHWLDRRPGFLTKVLLQCRYLAEKVLG